MTKTRILLVEGDRVVAKDMENSLANLGFEVCGSLSSGEEAIKSVKALHPDLVLMDINPQGKINGVEAAEAIRKFGHIPVINFTPQEDEISHGPAKLIGPYGYIHKPYKEKELYTAIDIALQTHKMERRMQKSREMLSTILQSLRDAVITTDKAGRITFINPAGEFLTGKTQEETLGKNLEEVIDLQEEGLSAGGASPLFRQVGVMAIKKGIKILVSAGRTHRHLEYSLSPLFGPGQSFEGTLITLHDVTSQKVAEQNFQDSEVRYQRLVEQPFFGVLVHIRGLITYINPAGALILGAKSPPEIIGKPFLDFVHSSSIDMVAKRIGNIYKTGEIAPPVEEKVVRLDGKEILLEVAGTLVAQDEYETAIQLIFHDVTQRKQTEQAQWQREQESRRLANESSLLAEIGKIISSTLDIEEVYELFSEKVKLLIPYDRTTINLLQKDGATLINRYVGRHSAPGRTSGEVFSLKGTLAERVIQGRKGVILDCENEGEVAEKYPGLVPELKGGLRSFLSVPLISRDRPIGALHFSSRGCRVYSEIDLALANGIATQIAGAIANAELFSELKNTERALKIGEQEAKKLAQENLIMANIGRILSSTLDPEEVYDSFASEVKKMIPFEKISINAANLEAKNAVVLYVTGRLVHERESKIAFPLKGSITEEVIRTKKGVVFHPENEDDVRGRFPGLLPVYQSGLRSMMAVPLISKDRAIAALIFMAAPQNDYTEEHLRLGEKVGNQISGAISSVQLFDELKKRESELRRGQIILKKVLDTLPVGVTIADKEGEIIFINPARNSIWQEDKVKEIGDLGKFKGWWPDTGKALIKEDWPLWRAIQNWETSLDKIVDIEDFAGQKKSVIHSAVPLQDENGEYFGAIGVIQDISVLKETQEQLERSEEHFRSLIENSSDIILTLDERGTILYASPSGERLLKYNPKSIIGNNAFQFIYSGDLPKAQEAFSILIQFPEMVKTMEMRLRHTDGSWKPFHITGKCILGEKGNKIIVVNCRDLTEQKSLENHLAQGQKLQAVGQLAAGIAHEINTPIQYVGDNTRFFQDAFKDLVLLFQKYEQLPQRVKPEEGDGTFLSEIDAIRKKIDPEYLFEEIPKAIQQTLEGVDRVTHIVRAMKEFSHPGTKDRAAIDLNRAIENTIVVARNEWKYVAEMDLNLDFSLPPVFCLAGEVNQVLLNMIVNAAHAIEDNLGNLPSGKGKITIVSRQIDSWAEIQIGDTGTGMPEEIQERIFEPFFTTKPVGKGTGQGLAIAYSVIVQKHGGMIDLKSEIGKGTTFFIRLPLSEPANPENPERLGAAAVN